MSNIRQYLRKIDIPERDEQFTNALIDGLDGMIAEAEEMITWSQDQFFLTTAEPTYLFKLAARSGFFLPRNAGLNVDGFRPLAPIVIYRPKTILETVLAILEIYFTPYLVRPNMTSSLPEPYSFDDGDDLIIRTRAGDVAVSIDADAFADINNITASELASYLNFAQDKYSASVFLDRDTTTNKIRLTSKGYGPGEIIQVIGGTMQNILKFPNIVPTTNTTGTRWTITKPSSYSDEVKFTYQSGPISSIFLVKIGDYVTMRNMFDVDSSGLLSVPVLDLFGNQIVDGMGNPVIITIGLTLGNYSVLNGSYQIVDVGYDFFVIRNRQFLTDPFDQNTVTGEWQELSPADFVFTEDLAHRITDNPQFALVNESQDDTLTITVPAVPPIVKRFLQGAWHIYGLKVPVTDFNRTTMQVDLTMVADNPPPTSSFVLAADQMSYDFRLKPYKATSNLGSLYTIDASGNNNVFPYTIPTQVDVLNPFTCDMDSDLVTMELDFPHGLRPRWQFNISAATINLGVDVNGPWIVDSTPSDHTVRFRSGQPNTGFTSLTGASLVAIDNVDFYLQFASSTEVTNAGLQVGKKFKLVDDGTVVYSNYAIFQALLVGHTYIPTSISGNQVFFSVDFPLPAISGTIASNVKTRTAVTSWGGSIASYFFDKFSDYNQEKVMGGLTALVLDFIQPDNANFLGSYIYDPTGSSYRYLPSRIGTTTTAQILEGESGVLLSVDDASEFPNQLGYLVLAYGTDKVEGPIRYLSTSGNQIVIDPAYVFQKTHSSGITVRYVVQPIAYSPLQNGFDYQPFITGTTTARDTIFDIMQNLVSAGVFIEEDVILPNLRFSDQSLNPYD